MMRNKLQYLIWLFRLFFTVCFNKIAFLFKKRCAPYRFLIKVTSCCNYRCKSCGNWKESSSSFLTAESQQSIIKKSKGKLLFLSVTGGEPFLFREDLVSFLEKVKQANPNLRKISINTNCSLSDSIYFVVSSFLEKFHDVEIKLGLHYIPSKKWGVEETGVGSAYRNYQRTLRVIEKLTLLFPARVSYYNMVTVGSKRELLVVKKYLKKDKPRDLWLNFAVVNTFYNNCAGVKTLSLEKQRKVTVWFLKNFSSLTTFMSRRYLKEHLIITDSNRKRRCYAGVNRLYFNEYGEEQICAMGVSSRGTMSKHSCGNCWTACEANFDLLEDLFLPVKSDKHQRDLA